MSEKTLAHTNDTKIQTYNVLLLIGTSYYSAERENNIAVEKHTDCQIKIKMKLFSLHYFSFRKKNLAQDGEKLITLSAIKDRERARESQQLEKINDERSRDPEGIMSKMWEKINLL